MQKNYGFFNMLFNQNQVLNKHIISHWTISKFILKIDARILVHNFQFSIICVISLIMQSQKVQQIFFQVGILKLNPYRQFFKYSHYNDKHFTKLYYIVQKSIHSFLHPPLHITSIMICIGQSFC
jgi:hypothetical protein